MSVRIRLTELLREHKDRLGSYERLVTEIEMANQHRKEGPRSVERRKLKRIIADESGYALTPDDLLILDNFLSRHGASLAELPLLQKESVVDALVHPGNIHFLLGAKPHVMRQRIDLWDFRSLADLLQRVHHVRPTVNAEIHDILFTGHYDEKTQKQFHNRLPKKAAAVCCIGSPMACSLAEMMMCEMCGIPDEQFQSPTALSRRLPFHFIWPPNPELNLTSRFALPFDQIPKPSLRRDVKEGTTFAFEYAGTVQPVHWCERRSKDYGVIVAQRRLKGVVWVVAGGVSGPGTWAAVRELTAAEFRASLPEATGDQHGQPLYVVVEADVRNSSQKNRQGDHREVLAHRIIEGPRILSMAS